MDPLQVAMTGVRMGEKYLQVFCSDTTLAQGLASKTGLSGMAALAAPDETHAKCARKAGEKAGAFIEIKLTPARALSWDADLFDMVVIDNTGGAFAKLPAAERSACLGEARRVLRAGGRVEFIERLTSPTGAEQLLAAAEFKPVRTLAERDGFRFVEGLKA